MKRSLLACMEISHFLVAADGEVIEWNQLQDVVIILQKANKIGFANILEAASKVKIEDAKYFNQILI